jgi:hypothetical protein
MGSFGIGCFVAGILLSVLLLVPLFLVASLSSKTFVVFDFDKLKSEKGK